MIKKLEHVGVKVKDMDVSIAFYCDVLGMKLVERVRLNESTELAFLTLAGSENVQIELICSNGGGEIPNRGRVDHIAFTVTDIEAEIAKLKDQGVNVLDEQPRTILSGTKIFFFTGPDGEVLELFEP